MMWVRENTERDSRVWRVKPVRAKERIREEGGDGQRGVRSGAGRGQIGGRIEARKAAGKAALLVTGILRSERRFRAEGLAG